MKFLANNNNHMNYIKLKRMKIDSVHAFERKKKKPIKINEQNHFKFSKSRYELIQIDCMHFCENKGIGIERRK